LPDLKKIIIGFIKYTNTPSNKEAAIIKIAVNIDFDKFRLKNLKIVNINYKIIHKLI